MWVVILTAFPQLLLQSTWVLYTTFRFGRGPREKGFSLFIVGIASALGQTLLLSLLLQKLGDVKTALAGLASSFVAYVLYGLAAHGWMMYAIILANLCGFAAGPALQGIVSKAVDPRHQGITLGSLNSISSIHHGRDLATGRGAYSGSGVRFKPWRLEGRHYILRCRDCPSASFYPGAQAFPPQGLGQNGAGL